jgi:hypothetical protein
MMEIVIKISKEDFEIMKHNIAVHNPLCPLSQEDIVVAIANGIPLPKGHGRLMILSEDKLKENQINLDSSCQKWISEVGLSNATVAIIEADKDDNAE